MKKSLFAAAGFGVALLAMHPAFAEDATIPAAPTATAAVAEEDPVICRKQETTGSRLGAKKVCKTKSEWTEDEERTKGTMRDIERRGNIGGSSPAGG